MRGALLLACALGGCESATEPRVPSILSANLTAVGPLARTLEITLSGESPLAVEYWTTGGPRLRLTSEGTATSHTLVLARLHPGREYEYEVPGTPWRGTFQTDPLPPDLEEVSFTASGNPTVPLVLLHLYDPPGFMGYAIVDGGGEVVWYFRTLDLPFGMTRRANGNFVLMDKARGLVEVTPAGTVVHELSQDTIQREQHHDVIATPQNTLLFIASDRRDYEGVPLKGEAVWEWSPESSTTTRRWTSWDYLSPVQDRGPRFGTEWLHANALGIGPRGNILLSVHYLNQIVSIAADWSSIEWRLGGVNASIAVPEEEQFSGQHTAREIAPGRVVLFDNRRDSSGPTSRAVEFEVIGDRAEKRWDWAPTPGNYASAVGAARRLDNGNTLVGFGMSAGLAGSTGPTEVYEVSAAGEVVWHLALSTHVMYRAEPLEAIGTERVVPQ